jgi:hypothetical protein
MSTSASQSSLSTVIDPKKIIGAAITLILLGHAIGQSEDRTYVKLGAGVKFVASGILLVPAILVQFFNYRWDWKKGMRSGGGRQTQRMSK